MPDEPTKPEFWTRPILSVADVRASCDYYCAKLGFTVAWSAGIWIAQAIFSTWWLKRYNFGPFEWFLRSFTYWKWQPIKKKEIIQTAEQS